MYTDNKQIYLTIQDVIIKYLNLLILRLNLYYIFLLFIIFIFLLLNFLNLTKCLK